jgi:DNA-binding LytR/AlgR family response regulator
MFVSNEKSSFSEPVSDFAPHFLYFRVDRRMVKVFLNDILFFESYRDYLKIFTTGKPLLTKQPLSNLEELLPSYAFLRIHRSYIVALNKIESFNAESVEINKLQLPIGRMYKHDVLKTLNATSANSQKP